VTVNNRYFPILRGQKFMHMGGRNRFFVPLGALGAVLIGGSYWNPDGYVSIAGGPVPGFTPDGCRLQWRMVDFVDGGGEPQCVQYCPVAGPPPARIATLPPPPPLSPQGTCELTIFSDRNFAGTSAPTGDNQQNLADSGWQNAISSIQVQSGTWDFFTDDDYGGKTMRLAAGTYPTLTPDWNKKINSFMCVAPGPGA
jgi:Beta/Gamma crystallin